MSDSSYSQKNTMDTSLTQHLLELRKRMLKCLIAVALLFVSLLHFANDLYQFISEPLRTHLPAGSLMIATEVTSPFLAPLKLTAVIAFFLAIPYILHQAWAFIAPGLYQKEKRMLYPILITSVVLFYSGMAFAYYIVFPLIFLFFTAVGPESITMMTDISKYLDFILTLFFAFGITFEIPVAIVLLVSSGVTSIARLKVIRPYIIIGCFVVGMLLTPPDVISQTLLAVPMWLLFELGVLVATGCFHQKQST